MTLTNIAVIVFGLLVFMIVVRKRMTTLGVNVKNVNAEQANQLIKENKNMLILDVRTKDEYSSGHIPGAKLIPVADLASRIQEIEKYKELPVLVYCASGGRSPGAVSILSKNGFNNIIHLNRGISSWTYGIKR